MYEFSLCLIELDWAEGFERRVGARLLVWRYGSGSGRRLCLSAKLALGDGGRVQLGSVVG
jgi:hypothetical protein